VTTELAKLSTWIPVMTEALEDAPYTRAIVEYAIAEHPPLTTGERFTGWRSFTSSEGVTLRFRVGWREAVYQLWRDSLPLEPECDD
jgi:hypothetical protein